MGIDDERFAATFLSSVNYYRFCGYALHYEEFRDRRRTHHYKPGTTFHDIVSLYEFDSRLRTLLFSFIEHIEVAFRTAVCLELSLLHANPHWYLDKAVYAPGFDYARLIDDCGKEFDRSRELFITCYKEKYSSPKLPPSWMLAEIMPLGTWSKIYCGLARRVDKKTVAKRLDISPWLLESWIAGLNALRNMCAHHNRIWNRSFHVQVRLPESQKPFVRTHDRLAPFCFAMAALLAPLARRDAFREQFTQLLGGSPDVPVGKMGFADSWLECPVWNS